MVEQMVPNAYIAFVVPCRTCLKPRSCLVPNLPPARRNSFVKGCRSDKQVTHFAIKTRKMEGWVCYGWQALRMEHLRWFIADGKNVMLSFLRHTFARIISLTKIQSKMKRRARPYQMAPQMVVRHPITLTFGTKHVHVLIHEGFL